MLAGLRAKILAILVISKASVEFSFNGYGHKLATRCVSLALSL